MKNEVTNINSAFRKLKEIEFEIKDYILSEIEKIQPLPAVKKAGKNFVIISSSSLCSKDNNFSPEYYIVDAQKNMLKDIVNSSKNLDSLISKLQEISSTGKIQVYSKNSSYNFIFNENSMKCIQEIVSHF